MADDYTVSNWHELAALTDRSLAKLVDHNRQQDEAFSKLVDLVVAQDKLVKLLRHKLELHDHRLERLEAR